MEDALNIIARLNINLYIKLNPPKDDWNSADIDAKREYVQTAVREHIELYMDDYLKNIDIVLIGI